MQKTPKREMIGTEGKVLLDTLRRLHRKKAVENCIRLVKKTHPADLAWVFRSMNASEQEDIFQIIAQTDIVADFLSELDESIMVELVDGFSPRFLAKVVGNMASDDAADLLDALPDEVAVEIQTHMDSADRHEVEELLKYHPETAGGLMSPDFMYLDEDLTVEEAIKKVQKRSEEKEMVFYLYITHGDGQLAGVLSLRELILQPMHRQLKNIMNTKVISVTTDTDQEEVAHVVSQYNLLAVPVVDATFKLVGIITVDDVIDVIRQEATEDFLQMAGAGKDQEILLKSTLQNAFIRAPWLAASWVGGVAAMFIITAFEGELMKTLALASFIPVVIGMGGKHCHPIFHHRGSRYCYRADKYGGIFPGCVQRNEGRTDTREHIRFTVGSSRLAWSHRPGKAWPCCRHICFLCHGHVGNSRNSCSLSSKTV